MAFSERWSREQRDAVIAAALDHGMTYQQVTDAAAAGQLPGIGMGLDPFPMPKATVAHYAGAEKRRRGDINRAAAEPAKVLEQGIGQLARLFAVRSERLSKLGHKADMAEVRKTAAAGREVLALQRELAKGTGTAKPDPVSGSAPNTTSTNGHDPGGGFVSSLVKR